jgi:hypothetical protein
MSAFVDKKNEWRETMRSEWMAAAMIRNERIAKKEELERKKLEQEIRDLLIPTFFIGCNR